MGARPPITFFESSENLRSAVRNRTGRSLMKFQGEGPQLFGERRELPIAGFIPTGLRRTFDLMPDGKRFVMLFRGPVTVGVVANWTTRLPTGR